MPFVLFGRKQKVRPVPDGRAVRRACPECGGTTTFRECVVEKTYTAYAFVDLWSSETTNFVCSACQAVMELEETGAPELTPREREEAEARAEAEAAEARARAEARRAERERAAEQRERAIDDELLAIKRSLGVD